MRTRWTRFIALLAALLLVVAACGGDDDDGTTGSATDTTEEEGMPRAGGTLVLAEGSDIDTLDPLAQPSYNTHRRIGLVYDRLLRFATGPDVAYGGQALEPELAEEWEIADDGLTYTFHLRDDVVWQDVAPVSGRPFVADDVVATFTAIQQRGFQRHMLQNVRSIEAPDEHTVVLRLSEPFAPLENFMANHHMWILPREALSGGYDPSQTAIGTGPFIMTRRERNVETVYERNPDYWQDGRPYLDGIRMLVIPDQTAKIASLRSGDLDVSMTGLSPQDVDPLLRTNPDIQVEERVGSGIYQLFANESREPWDDLRLRQAISMAIDREAMAEALFGGGIYAGPVVPALGEWPLEQDELAEYQQYDPEGARELLAEAGFPDGMDTTLMVSTGYGDQVIRLAEWVAEDLAKVGIRARLDLVEYATYIGARWPGLDYDIGIGPQTSFNEVDEWLRGQFHSEGSRNWWAVSDPELDAMIEEQGRLIDPDERLALVKEIQRYILDNVLNPVPVISPAGRTPQQPWVKGWYEQPYYGYSWINHVWLDR